MASTEHTSEGGMRQPAQGKRGTPNCIPVGEWTTPLACRLAVCLVHSRLVWVQQERADLVNEQPWKQIEPMSITIPNDGDFDAAIAYAGAVPSSPYSAADLMMKFSKLKALYAGPNAKFIASGLQNESDFRPFCWGSPHTELLCFLHVLADHSIIFDAAMSSLTSALSSKPR